MQTEVTEITVQYVNPPKEGKKWGSIKAADGNYYYGPPATLSRYQVGETCKIEFELGGKDGTLRSLKQKLSTTPPALAKPLPTPPRQRTNPTDSEQIFCCALLKEIIAPTDTELTLIAKTNMLRQVYRNTFGGLETQRDDEMRDEIPH